MSNQWGHQFFSFQRNGKNYSIYCHGESTRSGFKHVGDVFIDNDYKMTRKLCYINRTWESYTYQSLLHEIIHDLFSYETKDYSKSKRGRTVTVGPMGEDCEKILASQE